jgi:hypothetical protein
MPPTDPREVIVILQARPRNRSPQRNPQNRPAAPRSGAREQHVFGKSMIARWREEGRGRILDTTPMTKFRRTFRRVLVFCCARVRAADCVPHHCHRRRNPWSLSEQILMT